ncbi:MAG: alpha/beta hydrolase [Pseudonocardiales bacterium]|nr:alpha/beta hydrolase [Pseudonocardiales bacterium]
MATATSNEFIDGLADFWAHSKRSPVFRRPDEVGLEYEDVFFPSMDGVALDGWFIPAESDRLIIHNHFMPGNRYGYPGHMEGFTDFGGFEVSFLPAYRALHDAGYNVLCYDLRNHGLSGTGNGGTVGIGLLEYRDVIGSIRYAKSRPDTADMIPALLSVCLGCNSTIVAIDKHPEEFADIKALLGLQPISARAFIERAVEDKGIKGGVELFDDALHRRTGFHVDEQSPIEHAKSVQLPTLIAQVHDDVLTRPSDVQTIYDNIPATDKKLFWIEGTDQRFRGYNYFGERPELMLEWFDSHMK